MGGVRRRRARRLPGGDGRWFRPRDRRRHLLAPAGPGPDRDDLDRDARCRSVHPGHPPAAGRAARHPGRADVRGDRRTSPGAECHGCERVARPAVDARAARAERAAQRPCRRSARPFEAAQEDPGKVRPGRSRRQGEDARPAGARLGAGAGGAPRLAGLRASGIRLVGSVGRPRAGPGRRGRTGGDHRRRSCSLPACTRSPGCSPGDNPVDAPRRGVRGWVDLPVSTSRRNDDRLERQRRPEGQDARGARPEELPGEGRPPGRPGQGEGARLRGRPADAPKMHRRKAGGGGS